MKETSLEVHPIVRRFLEEVSLDSLRGDPDFEAIVARSERVVPGN